MIKGEGSRDQDPYRVEEVRLGFTVKAVEN